MFLDLLKRPGDATVVAVPLDVEPVVAENLADLQDETCWARFLAGVVRDTGRRDRLLLQFNLARQKTRHDADRFQQQKFLAAAYDVSGDIRYLNELLWLDCMDTAVLGHAAAVFRRNLVNGLYPRFPGNRAAACAFPAAAGPAGGTLDVALLGRPYEFRTLAPRLGAAGHRVAVFNFRQARSTVKRVVFGSRLLSGLLFLLKGWRGPWHMVPVAPSDSGVSTYFRDRAASVGVQRLGLILRRPLFDGFAKGILNDHWGILPWIRGRSSVEYALLYGLPVGATVHFMDEGIDTGPIVRGFRYDVGGCRSISAARDIVARHADDRIVSALAHVAAGAPVLANPPQDGVRYFSMHPVLARYIEEQILPARPTLEQRGYALGSGS